MQEIINFELFHLGNYSLRVHNIVGCAIIIIVTMAVLLFFKRVVQNKKAISDKTEARRRYSIYLLIKYVVWVVSIIAIIETLGFKVQIILAGSAALLVGIGLGLQNIFSDFMSGIFLLIEGTIKVGEVIEVDGIIGKVEEINLRNSQILTRDNVVVIVPNSKFVSEKVVNWSKNHDSVRFSVEIGVAYGSDVRVVRRVLEDSMTELPEIEKSPEPFVRFTGFGESSVDFELIFWTQNSFRVENLKSDLRFLVYEKLYEHNITIPFPQRDVHIIKD
jgi:small-conductance mechanosensitive channel